jgi:hypothetical protein
VRGETNIVRNRKKLTASQHGTQHPIAAKILAARQSSHERFGFCAGTVAEYFFQGKHAITSARHP